VRMLPEAGTAVNRGALCGPGQEVLVWIGPANGDRTRLPASDHFRVHSTLSIRFPVRASNAVGTGHSHRPSAVCLHTLLSKRAIEGMLRVNSPTFAGHVD
jgi:hypothetical protein